MPTPADSGLLTMDGWPGGINNRVRETEQQFTQGDRSSMKASETLRDAVNVDLTKLGHPIRREGYQLHRSGFTHSLWSHPAIDYGVCVHDGYLSRVTADGDVIPLQEVQAYRPVTYAYVNGHVYWSNDSEKGAVSSGWAGHWGLPEPPQPEYALIPGSLAEGRYAVVTVWVDQFGEEYGASKPSVITTDGQSSISVASPQDWPDPADKLRVFVSQPDGEVLYEGGESLAPGMTVDIHPSVLGRGRELETEELKTVKPCSIVRYFNGRLYMARNDTVTFTEPLRYSLTRPAQGIYMFSSKVTLLEPSLDGLYVGTDEGIVFIAGSDPYDIRQTNVSRHAPVPRAVTTVPGEFMGADQAEVPAWWGIDGALVAGLPGGNLQQLSKDRIATPNFGIGAMMYREREGMAQLVSSLRNGGEQSQLAATDTAVAEVRRNTTQLNL